MPTVEERRIVFEAKPWFEELQRKKETRKKQGEGQEVWMDVLEYSRNVCYVMGRIDDPARPEDAQMGVEEDVILCRRAVWELVEMIYVDRSSAHGFVAEGVVQWLQRNTILLQAGEEEADMQLGNLTFLLKNNPVPETQPEYWRCLQRLTALGWTTLVVEALGKHSAWVQWKHNDQQAQPQVSVLEAVTLLLRTVPRYKTSSLQNMLGRSFEGMGGLMHFRKGWLQQCQQLIGNHDLWAECGGATAVGLLKILAILAGDEETLEGCTCSWLELFAARLLHVYPNLKAFGELGALASSCMKIKGGGEGELDKMLMAVLERDTQELVNLSSNLLGPWMMAHITELLTDPAAASAPLSSSEVAEFGSDQVEYYRVLFAMSMASDPSMWKVAVAYLAWCPVHGARATESLFQRLPFHQWEPRTIQQALHCCDQLGLRTTADDICRRAGSYAWQQGHAGTAIYWFQRAGDEKRLRCLGRKLLDRVSGGPEGCTVNEAEFTKLTLMLETLEATGNIPRGDLSFLVGYHSLTRSLKQWKEVKWAIHNAQCTEDQEAAASQLHILNLGIRDQVLDLIQGGKAPRRFWFSILFLVVPLMEGRDAVFNVQDTQALVDCIEEVTPETVLHAPAPIPSDDRLHLLRGTVRLALVRNLARSFTHSVVEA